MSRSGRTTRMLLVAAMVTSAVACTSENSSDGGGEQAASCAYRVLYQDRTYRDVANVEFTAGEKLGPATIPPCDDTGGQDEGEQAGETTTVHKVDGVSPEVAVAVGDAPGDVIFVAAHLGDELPPEIRKLIDGS
ncbi:hypothetical protein JL475_32905 [Streptomyces sp. M2CJ-2]|uniref:DUF6281 family protein n=1 Tax=Streptomyces sp. M2CJ-2 TaxID=2803948 RepID=UPI001926B8C5|nr:DUF6281 family protein [Streptomyces sp. M2CJ-2]MBL3670685.1 hypothetical protein [Streptomyces sp. M2CJ-2]